MPAQDRLPRGLFCPDLLKEGASHRLALFGFPGSVHLAKVLERVYQRVDSGLQVIRIPEGGPAPLLGEFACRNLRRLSSASRVRILRNVIGTGGQSVY